MLVPLALSLATDGQDLDVLALSAITTAAAAGSLLLMSRRRPGRELKQREAILLVALIWAFVCGFGALPLYFSPYFATFSDAFFESVSGFTTTGATILDDIERLSPPILFWRCFSHWLGGMGIVLLGVAILPLLGQGGSHLYRAEFSGARAQRLTPRVLETAKALWKIYVLVTLAAVAALYWAGMDALDAWCHAFTAVATGGFSTRNASAAAFDSALIEYILSVFMILGGMSFILHYRLWVERRPRALAADYELRAYLLIMLVAGLTIAIILLWHHGYTPEHALRAALFQASSIMTTTGLVSEDYGTWYPLCQLILLLLMFVGGCTGSTAGGLKAARIVMLERVVARDFRRMAEPHGVFHVRVNGDPAPETAIQGLLNLVYLAFLVSFVACLLLTAMGVDVFTALVAVWACMFNVGPGLGEVGPTASYGHLPALAKWVLSLCMIAGRLEFYTLLMIFTAAFWRR